MKIKKPPVVVRVLLGIVSVLLCVALFVGIFAAMVVVDMGGGKAFPHFTQFCGHIFAVSHLTMSEVPADTDLTVEKVRKGDKILCFRREAGSAIFRNIEVIFIDVLNTGENAVLFAALNRR